MSEMRRIAVAACPKCNEVIWSEHNSPVCPRCREPLPESIKASLPKLQQTVCKSCGTLVPNEAKFCPSCGASPTAIKQESRPLPHSQPLSSSKPLPVSPDSEPAIAAQSTPQYPSPGQSASPFNPESRESKSAMKRYNDAYKVARAIVFYGHSVQVIGTLIAVGVGAILLTWFNYQRAPQDISAFLSFMIGATLFTFFFIIGIMINAQGQRLKASLDGAVHSSPFLNDAQRAKVMSL